MSGSNVTGKTKTDNRSNFDNMPKRIRQVFLVAPHDFHSMFWEKGPDLEHSRRVLILELLKTSAVLCLQTYGPEHPCYERLMLAAKEWRQRYFPQKQAAR
jgi:hypothetical protein